MQSENLLNPCPVCEQSPLALTEKIYRCDTCGLTVSPRSFLGFKRADQYVVQSIGDDYAIARQGIEGRVLSEAGLKNLSESVYSDGALAEFADGNFEQLRMPASVLAQVLLEQLNETCHVQIDDLRRAHGPAIDAGGSWLPEGVIPASQLDWQDDGNLFLTNARLVFPSNTFTFIRLDRKLVGLRAFEDGIAVQRRGDDFATYFVGCGAHQSALAAAYIVGKVAGLQQ